MQKESSALLTPDHPVVQHLVVKRVLLREHNPAHQKIKTGFFINGGIMLGSYSGGVVTGLENAGMTEVFDWAVSQSAGTCALAYFLARQSALGTSIYYEDLAENAFINFLRVNKIAEIDLLIDTFRGVRGRKKLDVNVLNGSRTNLMVALTDIESGQIQYINCKDPRVDPIDLLHGSVAMPIVYNRPVEIMERFYCDGGIGFGDPIKYMVEQLGCTDILVVSHIAMENKPMDEDWGAKFAEALLAKWFMRKDSQQLKEAFLTYRKRSDQLFDDILLGKYNRSGVNIALLCIPGHNINPFTMNASQLRWLPQQGRQQIEAIFGKLDV